MIKKFDSPDTLYTQQVKQLIEQIWPSEFGKGSVFEDAWHYFRNTPLVINEIGRLKEQLGQQEFSGERGSAEKTEKKLKQLTNLLEQERLDRIQRLHSVALRIIDLCEDDTFEDTQNATAKFLGTLLLLTHGPENNFAKLHQRLKPLYKTSLTLRLCDKVLANRNLKHPYLKRYHGALTRFKGNRQWREKWVSEVAIPLIIGSMLQDVGLLHPDAEFILKGENGDKDEFRVLEPEERINLLRLNFTNTIGYLREGLGIPPYVGNDKDERDEYLAAQKLASEFVTALVKDAFKSKSGMGEILKIPQIYASIILSTKPNYSRKDLPRGYLLIEQLAKKGMLHERLCASFIGIVGYFPQGFGVTYIPQDSNGELYDRYEFAIVNRLNPKDPAEPVCRIVTRSLSFISSGCDEPISKEVNLYYKANHKKLIKMDKAKLQEILTQLSGDFAQENMENLIPMFWEPSAYFTERKHQNLWNKARAQQL